MYAYTRFFKVKYILASKKKEACPDLSLCNFGCIFIDFQHAVVDLKELNGLTPLHLACHEGYFEMVELLIKNSKH